MIGRFESWEQLARRFKELWTGRGLPDMPPAAIAIRGGAVLAMAVAPRVQSELALGAARLLRCSFDADEVAFLSDGYCARHEAESPPAPGELQALWQAGRRETVREALLCVVAGGLRARMVSLPYVRRGRLLEWSEVIGSDDPRGDVPAILRQIMREALLADNPVIESAAGRLEFDRERSLFHLGRAALRMLQMEGFQVFDLASGRHPEWCDGPIGEPIP